MINIENVWIFNYIKECLNFSYMLKYLWVRWYKVGKGIHSIPGERRGGIDAIRLAIAW